MRVSFLRWLLLTAVAVLVLELGQRVSTDPGEMRPSTGAGPHVILVYFDTLRADHLSGYGHPRPTSPFMDRLARRGAMIGRCFAPSSSTYPSVPATLTSQPGSRFFDSSECVLGEEHQTLAEMLRDAGFHTVGVSSSPLVSRRRPGFSLGGFEQGFDLFDDTAAQGVPFNWQRRSPEAVFDRAVSWLGGRPAGRFFLFLYVMDPHDAYRAPSPYRELHPRPLTRLEPIARGEPGRYSEEILRGRGPHLRRDDLRHLSALYDGEISYADAELGKLLRALAGSGLTRDTLLLVTSDHGEELGDHGGLKHGVTLYQEAIRVPLVLTYPRRILPGASRLRTPVSSLDLAPTILDLVGVAVPPSLQGRSILPLVMEGDAGERDEILTEALYSDTKALLSDRWKYIHHFQTEKAHPELAPRYATGVELYDLLTDPAERHDRSEDHPEIVSELHSRMMAALPEAERARLAVSRAVDIDDEARERLRELGYLR